ncbi:MAG: universal stress protein [Burkholderiaceae bacterium]
MHALRSLLVHIDPSPRCAVRLAIARELGRQHDATVTALYACAPSYLDLPFAMAEGSAGAFVALQQLDDDRRRQALALFQHERDIAGTGVRMVWRELAGAPLLPGFAGQALCSDLMLLGQHDADDLQTLGVAPDFVASVLVASGRPALVVPNTGSDAALDGDVLIAWKASREAAHAVTAALPILHRARRIHVCAANAHAGAAGPAELEAWLRLHGIEAAFEHHASVPAEMPGEGLLSLAADVEATLLVMGCYGHSRARELVLGGASRTILRSMTLPVLMAH